MFRRAQSLVVRGSYGCVKLLVYFGTYMSLLWPLGPLGPCERNAHELSKMLYDQSAPGHQDLQSMTCVPKNPGICAAAEGALGGVTKKPLGSL